MDNSGEPQRGNSLLTGDLRRTLFFLALPVLAEQFMNFFVGFVDTYLSGHATADPDFNRRATSAIGVAAYVGWLSSMMFGLVGVGTTALVSRYWGAGDKQAANHIANRSMMLAVLLGITACATFYFAAPLLATAVGMKKAVGMEGERYRIAVRYLQIDAFGHMFHALSMIGAAALRGSGNTRSPMFILGTVSLLNLIVSPLLVFGAGPVPALEIDGIVAGTVIARCCGGLLMLTVLSRGIRGLKLSLAEMKRGGDNSIRRILRIGLPACADGAVLWMGHIVFLKIINSIGENAFAAHVIGIQAEAITYLPAIAWGIAAATMTGQSLGNHNIPRARRAGHEAALQCSVLAGLISLFFVLGSEQIYQFMHTDPSVWKTGVFPFRFAGFFQIPLGMSIIYMHSLRGAGDTRYPMLINLCGTFLVRVPGAYVCVVVLEWGLFGAWFAMCADILLRAILLAVRHLRGRWVTTKV
ncbi:MAG: MATE family efflux transporter [Planctomycetaceae bacterium]|nr:MATE family efflux transporter [Planctomycetaceae bacterium]MBT6156702.1 MATE family efflux transporter [Planctomycetaceae bacterium]MBT6486455.1 MATE family efflux transporter [Planctomycetaceae bacterium]MBT6493705.1 MATE family efflux transporter [Planctomycetaceae bacterium]